MIEGNCQAFIVVWNNGSQFTAAFYLRSQNVGAHDDDDDGKMPDEIFYHISSVVIGKINSINEIIACLLKYFACCRVKC